MIASQLDKETEKFPHPTLMGKVCYTACGQECQLPQVDV